MMDSSRYQLMAGCIDVPAWYIRQRHMRESPSSQLAAGATAGAPSGGCPGAILPRPRPHRCSQATLTSLL